MLRGAMDNQSHNPWTFNESETQSTNTPQFAFRKGKNK